MAPDTGEGPSATPTGLPGLSTGGESSVLISRPLPSSGVATQRLLTGFPSFLRPPKGADIATSSLATDTDRVQVTLVASTKAPPEQVLSFYRARLSPRGMLEQAPPSVPGSVVAAFVSGRSTMTVTATSEGGRTSFTIYGVLYAGKA